MRRVLILGLAASLLAAGAADARARHGGGHRGGHASSGLGMLGVPGGDVGLGGGKGRRGDDLGLGMGGGKAPKGGDGLGFVSPQSFTTGGVATPHARRAPSAGYYGAGAPARRRKPRSPYG